jgi:hypothetical protein
LIPDDIVFRDQIRRRGLDRMRLLLSFLILVRYAEKARLR